jgi:2-polyprenyl-3-methyl-5-hydroxy-6-metoxy-1,4-benzoquinol methylase/Zn ribbon nucleic-acid-binding protein
MADQPGLTEEEIRPEALKAEQERTLLADAEWLVARRDRFRHSSCPMCDADEPTPAWHKHGLDFARCGRCGSYYLSPRPDPDLLGEFFARSEHYRYWNEVIFPVSDDARREKIFAPRAVRVAELARRHGAPMGTLVDVGAGFGTFAEEAQRQGAFERVIAIEPVPELAATCRRKGVETIEATVEAAGIESIRPDVVTSFEMLLHLSSPRAFLEEVGAVLPPGGLFVISTPNSAGFDFTALGELSSGVNFYNLNYPNARALSELLEQSGFDVLEVETPGRLDAELVRKQALAGAVDLSGRPFLQQVLIDDWERVGGAFQQFLADNLLSSHMWTVARRR